MTVTDWSNVFNKLQVVGWGDYYEVFHNYEGLDFALSFAFTWIFVYSRTFYDFPGRSTISYFHNGILIESKIGLPWTFPDASPSHPDADARQLALRILGFS